MHVFQTVLVLVLIKSATACLEKGKGKIWNTASKVILWIGRNTLYIFLYHILFRDISWKVCAGSNIWKARVCVGAVMLFGPLAIVYIKDIIWKWCSVNRERVGTDI